jgi:putative glycosyltransferase (TIGR04348 family)
MSVSGEPVISYDSENRLTGLCVGIVTPAPAGSRRGNRVTAERWECILRRLGHRPEVLERYVDQAFDLLVALHAGRSADSIRRFRGRHPTTPIILAITGTDVYGGDFDPKVVVESLAAADRIVVLQPKTADHIPEQFRQKVRVIFQSAEPPAVTEAPRADLFEVAVVGHLRPVKDPFRAAEASRLLRADSGLRVLHLGEALDPEMAGRAGGEMATNPRYQWLGDLPHEQTLSITSRCRLVVLTSLSEGGPAVIAEAIVAGVPVIATRVDGCVGMLGHDYPGLFEPGDTPALARLFDRAENDPHFYQTLREAVVRLQSRFHPDAEVAAWRSLLGEVAAGRGGPAA